MKNNHAISNSQPVSANAFGNKIYFFREHHFRILSHISHVKFGILCTITNYKKVYIVLIAINITQLNKLDENAEKISYSKTELIIYKLVRNEDLNDEEKDIIDTIVENKDYANYKI